MTAGRWCQARLRPREALRRVGRRRGRRGKRTSPPCPLSYCGGRRGGEGMGAAELLQPARGLPKGFLFLAEGKAQPGATEVLALVEAAAGNRGNARLTDEVAGGLQVVVEAEAGDVGEEKVAALGGAGGAAGSVQALQEDAPAPVVRGAQVIVVGGRKSEGGERRHLQH